MKISKTLICAGALLGATGGASADLEIPWYTINAGTLSGGTTTLRGVIGQPDAGTMTTGSLHLEGGFLVMDADGAPCIADFAAPFGTLDFFDILAYLGAFDAQDPAADLASPFGVWDFFDILAYLGLFDAGCP